jgi:hypothetical protein
LATRGKACHIGALDCGDVDEHIPAAALRLNESIALVGLNHFTVPRAIVDLS